MKVLFAAPPYRVGNDLGGIGLRIWELAQVLASEFDVTILVEDRSDFTHPGITFTAASGDGWADAIDAADAVLFNDLADPRMLRYAYERRRVIVSENAVPVEHLEYVSVRDAPDPDAVYQEIVDGFRLQMLVSDHVIVRSPVERASVVGALVTLGRLSSSAYTDPQLADLLTLIPIGFNRRSDERAAAALTGRPVDLIWTGGIWSYLDAESVVDAVALARADGTPLSLTFLYGGPANPGPGVRVVHKSIAHLERDAWLVAARATVCVAREGIENATCHRLRLRDALLYRLPIVVDPFGASGEFVERLGIGLVADPRDPAALADAMVRITRDESLRKQLLERLDIVRERHRLETTAEGLVRFLRRGRRARDAAAPEREEAIRQLLASAPRLAGAPTRMI